MTVRPYKVLLLTCVVNCTTGTPTPQLCSVIQWSVHWAPSQTTRVLVLARARHCVLEMCRGKKKCKLCFQTQLNLDIRNPCIEKLKLKKTRKENFTYHHKKKTLCNLLLFNPRLDIKLFLMDRILLESQGTILNYKVHSKLAFQS